MESASLQHAFQHVRRNSLEFCASLVLEDYCLQAEPFTSPPKWHLAHTTWFFETFILKPLVASYQPFNPHFEVLFNSYYNGIGEQFDRPKRGLLTRPTLDEILRYRTHVEEAMQDLLGKLSDRPAEEAERIKARTILGLEHEKQHQELFFMDIKYSFFQNPLYPALFDKETSASSPSSELEWVFFSGGETQIGVELNASEFCFDNEAPQHSFYLTDFEIAGRLVSNIDFLEFILAGGYDDPQYWLADGWAWRQQHSIEHPLYWVRQGSDWAEFTLYGLKSLEEHQPVCHVSAYEADAYAAWANARLVIEQEWEHAAKTVEPDLPASISAHPTGTKISSAPRDALSDLFGQCWQWTGSAYRPYPGFRAPEGAIGEYNGKFMSNQWVLRGSACVTPIPHARSTYRNFFYPQDRWQFSGIRLARSV